MDTTSHWMKSSSPPAFPRLEETLQVDVAVIGAGITGITTALLLKEAGLTVALVERGRCARVDTGHTTAHCTAVTDLRLAEMERQFGPEVARVVWAAGMTAVDKIEALARARGVDCRFARCDGFLHAARRDEDPGELRAEFEAARRLGIAAEWVDAVPPFGVPGVRFPDQALFHPLRYLAGLLPTIPGGGSHVFELSDAHEAEDPPRRIVTPHGRIDCGHIIFATHNPLQGRASLASATLLQSKLALYSTYAIAAELPPGRIPAGSYWDTAEPYRYLRVENLPDRDLLIYGGEDHKTGQVSDTPAAYARLEARLRAFALPAKIESRWSGQVIETNDGLPFIGEMAEREFVATGFSGNGMTFGTVAAMMAVDFVLGRTHPWGRVFDPHRTKVRGGLWSYLKENKDYPYHLVRGRLVAPDAESVRELPRGEGRILEMDGRRVAAYRDPRGRIHLCSAVCPHMQCIVGWNPAEHTWDCPCHGSRFEPDGSVMSGPAEESLERLSLLTGRSLPRNRRKRPAAR
ncbi:MAG TPA: FAD-dependent oxidoreductase [Opitutaceae bacterium]|nr:FAD-dependent oxidoreductase [Opitutaceae bacterium]